MARRFSDLRRGAKLAAAFTAYQAYLAKPPSTTLPTYKARPDQVALKVTPFGIKMETSKGALVYGGEPSVSGIQTELAKYASCEAADANAIKIAGFRAARVRVFQNTSKPAPTSETSKFTGQLYRKYDGESFALPFGAKASTNLEIDTGREIIAGFKARPSFKINRVSVSPERQKSN